MGRYTNCNCCISILKRIGGEDLSPECLRNIVDADFLIRVQHQKVCSINQHCHRRRKRSMIDNTRKNKAYQIIVLPLTWT